MRIKEESLQEIKNANDIVDVVSEVVKLKKTGSSFTGLCPFHTEKSSSFSVSQTRQLYKCFGCGEAGNVFSFVMKSNGLGFVDAVEKLAKRANIDIAYEGYSKEYENALKERNRGFEINKLAAKYFYKNLDSSKEAIEYFKKRGIDFSIRKKFGIGFAMNSWNGLMNTLKASGVSEKELIKNGLVIKNENGKVYDRFRNRVIFPIFDVGTKVIGFGGRVLDDSKPKYLNSPETNMFKKGTHLYGLNFAIRNKDIKEIIIVEGYMDCVSLNQFGIDNVVATLGVALTQKQAVLIKKYVDSVVVSFDADVAGQNAALRGIEILKNAGLEIKVLKIPDGKDPDEFVRKNGAKAFEEIVKNSQKFIEYIIDRKKDKYNFKDYKEKVEFIQDVCPILNILNSIELDIQIGKISDFIGVKRDAIYEMLELNRHNEKNMYSIGGNSKELYIYRSIVESSSVKAERTILNLLISKEVLLSYLDGYDMENIFIREISNKIYGLLVKFSNKETLDACNSVELNCQDEESSREFALIKQFNLELDNMDPKELMIQCIKNLQNQRFKETKERLIREIKVLEEQGKIEESRLLAKKIFEINREKEGVKVNDRE